VVQILLQLGDSPALAAVATDALATDEPGLRNKVRAQVFRGELRRRR